MGGMILRTQTYEKEKRHTDRKSGAEIKQKMQQHHM